VALTGALIRLGNYFNSEIIGKPTKSDYGVVFAQNVSEILESDPYLNDVHYVQVDSTSNEQGHRPIKILIEFHKDKGFTYEQLSDYLEQEAGYLLTTNRYIREHIDQRGPLNYHLLEEGEGEFSAIIDTYAIPRYPAQLYESLSCALLFALLFWLWWREKENLPPGRLLGVFLIVCFGLRFFYEFLKENQVDFENTLPLNMGQILSIPLVLIGIIIVILSYRKKNIQGS
jgi:prolipoprotein diacylglyceryltransferase